ncbi:MAG TPA: hypothetical protein VFD36_13645 [Kofleriaceae bacterium]|nr:hypothetical protein [Kofleriaceae bacterium]
MRDTAVEASGRGHARVVRLGFAAATALALTLAIQAGARGSAEASESPGAPSHRPPAPSPPSPPSPPQSPPASPSPSPPAPLSPPPAPAAPCAPATSAIPAASIAQHYIDVGRKIRILAVDRGAETASKLWESFRYIRINDALVDPAKRGETDARLRRIDEALAAQYAR